MIYTAETTSSRRDTFLCKIVVVLFLMFVGGSLNLQAQYSQEEIDSLTALAEACHDQWVADSIVIDSLASLYGFPIYDTLFDGRVAHVYKVVDSIPYYMVAYSADAVATISADKVWPGGGYSFGLSGDGIIIGMWDVKRPQLDHVELDGHVTYKEPPVNDDDDHATSVAGVLVAVGDDPQAKGTASDAMVWAYDFEDDVAELCEAAKSGILLSNHSYGAGAGWEKDHTGTWIWQGPSSPGEDPRFGKYGKEAHSMDEFTYAAKYNVLVKASGNHLDNGVGITSTVHPVPDGGTGGFDAVTDFGNSKNVITVGSVEDIPNGYSQVNDVVLSAFSSTGPTDDGRIKPDLVANGDDVFMPISNSEYRVDKGTSFAAPTVTGSLALLMELYNALYPDQLPLLSSTWKALLIHTADEAGANDGPDYKFGWGLTNTLSAAELLRGNITECCHISEHVLFEGSGLQKGEMVIDVESDGTEPLKVTICWTDPPFADYGSGTGAADEYLKTLINDLDLVVEGPLGGSSMYHYPWKLDLLNPGNAATSAVVGTANSSHRNSADNVEQVVIASPSAGTYRIRVTYDGTELYDDLQAFSMIVTGNLTNNADLTFDEPIENKTVKYQTGGKITTQAATFTIFDVEEHSDVTLVAGEKIVMKSGSRVREGNVFYAYICDPLEGGHHLRKETPPRHVVTGDAPAANGYGLLMSFPNPVHTTARIRYRVAEPGHVRIGIIGEGGNEVAVLVDREEHPAGDFDVDYDVTDLPSGSYYVSMNTHGTKLTQKILVLR